MGALQAAALSRRPRWRSYLLLSRVSNLPTVWTNVLAGLLAGSSAPDWPTYGQVGLAVSLFYSGGMFLNDAFDAEFDRAQRPGRPVPAGDLTRAHVYAVGFALLVAGEILLLPNRAASVIGAVLACAIVLYNARHKGEALAPLVMGVCRGLVYCAAAASGGTLSGAALTGAAVLTAYVVALTVVARLSGPFARWRVPVLLAGISLVDAGFLLAIGAPASLVLLASVGFPLTLWLQRFIPGD